MTNNLNPFDPASLRLNQNFADTVGVKTLRALRRLKIALRKAVVESKLGYQFNANSYSFSARNACIAAERELEVLSRLLFPLGDEPGSAKQVEPQPRQLSLADATRHRMTD